MCVCVCVCVCVCLCVCLCVCVCVCVCVFRGWKTVKDNEKLMVEKKRYEVVMTRRGKLIPWSNQCISLWKTMSTRRINVTEFK